MPDQSLKIRLDQALVEHGCVETRSKARDAIKRGVVRIDGQVCVKPGQLVSPDRKITFTENPCPYVSRGGLKLEGALQVFVLEISGKTAIDLGASTGGFTDVLLQKGAGKVYAIDVGAGQMHQKLREDHRVVVLENLNAKDVSRHHVQDEVDLIVCDVSFISLTKALPAVLALCGNTADLIALIKPQFEVGRARVGKGGIVREEKARMEACERVVSWLEQHNSWSVLHVSPSAIIGPDGNQEYLLHARKT